jgi:hypothetical protein
MIFGYAILAIAVAISAVAAYYSIMGLTAIFAAAVVPIIIMGGALELGKVISTVWLHNNWRRVPILFKLYLIPAVAFLMFLTSMGIFGFLSKAHSDQSLVSGDVTAKIAIYDEKIKIAKDNIEADRRALKQMDEAVDQMMGRSTDEKGADKAVAIRRGQQKERSRLLAEIAQEQKTISALNEERAPIAAEVRKVEAEVGPIKYIAAFVYGDNPNADILERAVRWVIILIVIVFDPLALCLILAANKQFEWGREGAGGWIHNEVEKQTLEPEIETPVDTTVYTASVPLEDFANAQSHKDQELQQQINSNIWQEYIKEQEPAKPKPFNHGSYIGTPYIQPQVEDEPKHTESKTTEEIVDEIVEAITPVEITPVANDELEPATMIEIPAGPAPKLLSVPVPEAAPGPNRGIMNTHEISADNTPDLGRASRSDFGNEFPSNPEKGDVYLRTDSLPNRLFKFNGIKWIEVDKDQTNLYAYDEMYIQHLVDEIAAGRYDADTLSDIEREQIKNYLSKGN